MKELKAIIQPFMLSKVVAALKVHTELPGVTVSDVKGFGRGKALSATEKIEDEYTEYSRKVKLEIVVPDYLVEEVMQIIQTQTHTGNPGDGKIFVYTVDDVMKIRTGAQGEQAI